MSESPLSKFQLDKSRIDLIKEYIKDHHPSLDGASRKEKPKLIKNIYIRMAKSGTAKQFYYDKVKEKIFEDAEVSAIIERQNKVIERNKKALEERMGRPINFQDPSNITGSPALEILTEEPERPLKTEQAPKPKPVKANKTKKRKVPVCIHFDEDMIADLKIMADDQERSYSSLIRLACKEYLKKYS